MDLADMQVGHDNQMLAADYEDWDYEAEPVKREVEK